MKDTGPRVHSLQLWATYGVSENWVMYRLKGGWEEAGQGKAGTLFHPTGTTDYSFQLSGFGMVGTGGGKSPWEMRPG